ncbi:MAG: hypothetical protein ABIB65_00380 [Candidatus Margulisiibacteriota bacterium]
MVNQVRPPASPEQRIRPFSEFLRTKGKILIKNRLFEAMKPYSGAAKNPVLMQELDRVVDECHKHMLEIGDMGLMERMDEYQEIVTGKAPILKFMPDVDYKNISKDEMELLIKFSRIWEGIWGKGKAENIVAEQVGFTHEQRMAGFMQRAMMWYTKGQHGFPIAPIFVQKHIYNGVVRLMQLTPNPQENNALLRQKGITTLDIYKDLQRHIMMGKSYKEAAKLVFKAFDIDEDQAKHARTYFVRKPLRRFIFKSIKSSEHADSSNHIYHNLEQCAREVALMTHAFEVANKFARGTKQDAKDHINDLVKTKKSDRKMRKQLEAILAEEVEEWKASEKAHKKANEKMAAAVVLRNKGKNKKAKKLEKEADQLKRLNFYGDKSLFACRYRHRKKHPILARPLFDKDGNYTAPTFEECMTLLVTKAPLAYEFNDNGLMKSEGKMLFDLARIVQERIDSNDQNLTSLKGRAYKHYRDLDPVEGRRLDQFRRTMRIEIRNLLGQEKYAKQGIKNYADWELHSLPRVDEEWGELRTIWDTDNIAYEEFMHGLVFFGPEYGGLTRHNIEVLHRVENYKLIHKALLITLQKWRDSKLHGLLARSRNNKGIDPSQVFNRHLIEAATGTHTGYAGHDLLDMLYLTMHSDTLENPQITESMGRKLLSRTFFTENFHDPGKAPKWADVKKAWHDVSWKKGKLTLMQTSLTAGANYLARLFGRESIWDVFAGIDFTLRATYTISGAFTAVTAALSILSGATAAAALLPFYGWVLGVSFGTWAALKGIAWLGGRDMYIHQSVSVARNYEFDASEDLLFSLFCFITGFTVLWDPGHLQQNDCTTSLRADMAQKLRWQAQNARLFRLFMIWALHYHETAGFKQAFDAVTPCVYNNWGMAATFNRIGVWSFIAFGMPPMLMPNNDLAAVPGQTLLNWIFEIALTNYTLIEGTVRISNASEGTPSMGTTYNFGYQNMYVPFNIENVRRRLWNMFSAGFNVTGEVAAPQMDAPWGNIPNSTPKYLRQSMVINFLNAVMIERVGEQFVRDGLMKGDILSVFGGTVGIWPLLDLVYTSKGLGLNSGIEPVLVDNNSMFLHHTAERQKPANPGMIQPPTPPRPKPTGPGPSGLYGADGKPMSDQAGKSLISAPPSRASVTAMLEPQLVIFGADGRPTVKKGGRPVEDVKPAKDKTGIIEKAARKVRKAKFGLLNGGMGEIVPPSTPKAEEEKPAEGFKVVDRRVPAASAISGDLNREQYRKPRAGKTGLAEEKETRQDGNSGIIIIDRRPDFYEEVA